jgi:hypothetical protein
MRSKIVGSSGERPTVNCLSAHLKYQATLCYLYTDPINIGSGVNQGCIMSPTLLLIILDWIMKKVTDKRTGLTWELQNKLKDNEFVDDVGLQTEKENHNMQRKYKNWRQNHKK